MHAIVFADRDCAGLRAVCGTRALALVDVAGKPAIEYSLEALAEAGCGRVTVVASADLQAVRELLGRGERWGLSLQVLASRGNEDPQQLLPRICGGADGPFLVLRGDELRDAPLESLLAAPAGEDIIALRAADGRVVAARCPGARLPSGLLHRRARPTGSPPHCCEFLDPTGGILDIDTPRALVYTSRLVLEDALPGLLRAGLQRRPGVRLGRLARLGGDQPGLSAAFVGDHAEVDASAELAGCVVVGARSVIDQDTCLRDCLVLPGTYVGAGLQFDRALIGPAGVYSLDRDRPLALPDPIWVGAVEPAAPVSVFDRSVALLLIVVGLPLWGMALGRGLLRRPAPLFRRLRADDVRGQPYFCLRFEERRAWLRELPGLLDVLAGRIDLLGASPGRWESAPDLAGQASPRPGLMSSAWGLLDRTAAPEAHCLTECIQAHRSPAGRLLNVLNAIFRRPLGAANASLIGRSA